MYRILTLLFILFIACSPKPSNSEAEQWAAQAENVTIIRDDFGVPHIYGKTDADAVFGLLYAQCEDDFRRVERNFTWAVGRLAETEGEEALYSDLRAHLFMTEAEAKETYASAPDWLKTLCGAWADGINYYLHTHPEVEPKAIKKYEPWMTMYFTEGSIGGDIERVSTRKIKAFYEGMSPSGGGEGGGSSQLSLITDDNVLEEPQGSNGFAISGDQTESGNAMLLINPHTSFYFRGEVHVVSEEGLNAYGAVTWGQFFVYQGFNENTGWMHTSTGTDIIDEFQETIIEKDDGLNYQYGEEERKVEVKEVTLKYRDGDEMKEKTFPIYRTHHGPITHETDGKWTATALMWKPVDALTQSYTRTKKKNLEEFHEMMNIRTNSSNNTVFADSEGNIAYYHGNFIPKRDVQFDYSQPIDGSNPATDWQGLHELDETIIVKNPPNGWIQNCNSTPFTAAAENSPKKEDYPYYMASFPENFRGVNAIRLLSQVEDLSLDGLIELGYNPYLPAFEKVIPGLVEAYDNAESRPTTESDETTDMLEAIEELRNWDFKTGVDSKAMTLAHFYGRALYQHADTPEGLNGIDRFHWFGTGLAEEERLRIFKIALEDMDSRYGTRLISWGEVNRFQRLSGDIDASFDDEAPSIPVGYTTAWWGHLAAYGMRGNHDVNKIYGTRGNSFVAAVEFGDKVRAKTILAGGQSSDPSSPHFDDQAEMYASGEFKEAAFYREDVEARAEETYKPGKR
ncbi:penicillin acylase family protein [Ekhidna sp.]|uniref:penicillin acylase family protein n=1 Tax=Ekhidna sp. TaxID=2608089 RepID=UPI003C7CABA2